MKSSVKKFLVGTAILATTVVTGGAFYANNVAIPERLAIGMNAAFDDAYKQAGHNSHIKVESAGSITVEPAGILKYRAIVPTVSMKVNQGDFNYDIKVGTTLHTLKMVDVFGLKAQLISDGPVPVKVDIKTTSPDMDSVTVEGFCNTVKHDLSLQDISSRGEYTITTNGDDCTWKAEIEGGYTKMNIDSELAFQSSIVKNGDKSYSGVGTVSLEGVTLTVFNKHRDMSNGTVKIGKFDIGTSYGGMSVEEEDPVIPQNISASLSVKDLDLSGVKDVMFPLPKISFDTSLGLRNMKEEKGSAKFNVAYSVSPEFSRQSGLPQYSDCKFDLGNIPAKELSNLAFEKDENKFLQDFEKYARIVEESGITLGVNCKSGNGDLYQSIVESMHTVLGDGSFPGAGKFELRGVDKFVDGLSSMLGSNVSQIAEVFKDMAQPTEDGKGLVLNYNLDKTGNLTVNGQALGRMHYQNQ